MFILRVVACAWGFLLGTSGLAAREYFVTVHGSGSRDGANWENAAGADRLTALFNETMQPGDRLLMGGGTYRALTLVLSRGGEAGRVKEWVGVDRGEGLPVFDGDWSVERPAHGATAIQIAPGVSHVTLRRIRIRGYVHGIRAPAVPSGSARSHLRFEDVGMEQMRHGFHLADCDDLQFRACVLKRYTKHGFRFEQGCNRVRLEQCVADCTDGDSAWETRTELFPFGYLVNDGGRPNTGFVFKDCVARHHVMPLQTNRYRNGDGFVVEGNASDVEFVRCRSIRNQDAGFDIKVRDVRLQDCVAVGNSRGFRIWHTGTLDNCFAGWGTVALWNNGGPVQARRCTFHALSDAAVMTDDAAAREVTLVDCRISATATSHRNTARGVVVLRGTVLDAHSGDGNDRALAQEWDGLGDAMDSKSDPGKGYSSARLEGGR
jgi:hypothetical protein